MGAVLHLCWTLRSLAKTVPVLRAAYYEDLLQLYLAVKDLLAYDIDVKLHISATRI